MVDSQPTRDIGRVFVGRQREMAQLQRALNDTLSGQGRMVMLVGEPGIGKTRTAQELASYAEWQGAKVLWGWCYEEEGAPPYWPWVQTIRTYVQECDAGQLRTEMGHGAANIADVVPEIQSKITDLKPPPTLEPEAARFRLFDSITTFLKNAAQGQPLLLVLHARIAEALEELYGEQVEVHAAELAHHFAEAQTEPVSDKLVRYSLLAGERALAAYAYEDALTHFERGLVAREVTLSGTEAVSQAASQVPSDEEAADLLFGLARAQSATVVGHQLVEAFAILSRAFDYYAAEGEVAQAVAAAEFPIAPLGVRIPGVAHLMARALTLVPADSHEAGRLFSRYGGILGVGSDYEGAQQALGRAIAIARREGDVPLEVQTLTYATLVSGQHLRWQESVDNGLRAIELATDDENPFSVQTPRFWTAVSLLYMGELEAARPHALGIVDLAERRSHPRQLVSIGFVPIMYLACLEGDWKAGREYSDRGLEVSPLNPQLLLPRVLLEHETGESAQGEV